MDTKTNGGRDRYRLSATLRTATEQGGEVLHVKSHNIRNLIESVRRPRTLMEGIDRLLETIDRRSPTPTAFLKFDANRDYPATAVSDGRAAQTG